MDILKRSLAPVTGEAWAEIDAQAADVLRGVLTGRRVADVSDPKGWRCDSVSSGTLSLAEGSPVEGVNYGIREVLPLVEVRVPFSLPMWDLDDISRGCRTTDFTPLQQAARRAALFEDTAIFKGLEEAGILGIEAEADNSPVEAELDDDSLIKAVYEATHVLSSRNVGGPYALVCSKRVWEKIATSNAAYPLRKSLGKIVDKIIISRQYDADFVTSLRGGDSELVIGQDFSVGYQSHSTTEVNFYITETFTFRVVTPEAFVPLAISE